MGNRSDTIVDKIHFQNLAKLDPIDLCRQTLCKYNYESKKYSIYVWDNVYNIYPSESKIDCIKCEDSNPNELFYLLKQILFTQFHQEWF